MCFVCGLFNERLEGEIYNLYIDISMKSYYNFNMISYWRMDEYEIQKASSLTRI